MMELDELAERIKNCKLCPLRETATCPVPGYGNYNAKYVIVGEAPGGNEDKAGIPFVGLAGKRLDQLLALAKIDIEDVYLTNVCRCRPPDNRTPRKVEVNACKDFLFQEIRIIKPEFVITLGATPLKLFSSVGVSQMHGSMFEYILDD